MQEREIEEARMLAGHRRSEAFTACALQPQPFVCTCTTMEGRMRTPYIASVRSDARSFPVTLAPFHGAWG